jgi:hypothetical protein
MLGVGCAAAVAEEEERATGGQRIDRNVDHSRQRLNVLRSELRLGCSRAAKMRGSRPSSSRAYTRGDGSCARRARR